MAWMRRVASFNSFAWERSVWPRCYLCRCGCRNGAGDIYWHIARLRGIHDVTGVVKKNIGTVDADFHHRHTLHKVNFQNVGEIFYNSHHAPLGILTVEFIRQLAF